MDDHQERYEADARAWLARVDVPPPRLEVDQLVATAQQATRRRRRLVASGTGLVVLAALAAAAAQVPLLDGGRQDPAAAEPPTPSPTATADLRPVECEVTVLEPPAELAERGVKDPSSVHVTAMDPTGRYVVGDTYGGFNNSPVVVLWDGGSPTIIPDTSRPVNEQTVVDSDHYEAVAVNVHGEVVGYGASGDRWFGWVYRDGELTDLTMPAGFVEADVAGINEAGDVVGSVQDSQHLSEVVVWPAESPEQPRFLDAPDGEEVSPSAILDDGTVVGWFHGSTGGYLWSPDGDGRELPLPAGAVSGTIKAARGQWAVGTASFPLSDAQARARLEQAEHDGLSDEERSELEQHLREGEEATLPAPVRWDLRTGTATVLPGFEGEELTGSGYVGYGGNAVNPDGDVVIDNFPGYEGTMVLREDGREVVLPATVEGAVPSPVAITTDGSGLAGNIEVIEDGNEDPYANEAPGQTETDPAGFPQPVTWNCRL